MVAKGFNAESLSIPRGVGALFSCSSGEFAHESEKLKHGVFFHYVLEGLRGKARDQESADESLQLSLYALAAQQKWDYKVGALIFHNLEQNLPVMTLRSEAQLRDARVCVEEAALIGPWLRDNIR